MSFSFSECFLLLQEIVNHTHWEQREEILSHRQEEATIGMQREAVLGDAKSTCSRTPCPRASLSLPIPLQGRMKLIS